MSALVVFLGMLLLVVLGTSKRLPRPTSPGDVVVASQNIQGGHLSLGDTVIAVELATTTAQQELGLSYRSSLPVGHGMWFVLPAETYQGLWMKDMHFALDMIWVDHTLTVVDIKSNVTPDSYPTVFTPRMPAQYVLEVNTGFAAAHHVEIGGKIKLLDKLSDK